MNRFCFNTFMLLLPISYFIFLQFPFKSILSFVLQTAIAVVYIVLSAFIVMKFLKIKRALVLLVCIIICLFYSFIYLSDAHFGLNLFIYEFNQSMSVIVPYLLIPFLCYIPGILIILILKKYELENKMSDTLFSAKLHKQCFYLLTYLLAPLSPFFFFYRIEFLFGSCFVAELIVKYSLAIIFVSSFILSIIFFDLDKDFKLWFIVISVVVYSLLFAKSIHFSFYLIGTNNSNVDMGYLAIGQWFTLIALPLPLVLFFIPGSFWSNIQEFSRNNCLY